MRGWGSAPTRVAVKRGNLLRGYAFDFIELFAPALNRKLIRNILQMKGQVIAICLVIACGIGAYVMAAIAGAALMHVFSLREPGD